MLQADTLTAWVRCDGLPVEETNQHAKNDCRTGHIAVKDDQRFAVCFNMPTEHAYKVKLIIDGEIEVNRAVQIGEGGGYVSTANLTQDGTQAKPFIFSVKEDAEATTPKASTWEKSKSLKHQQLTGIIKLIVTECELEQVTVTNEPVAHHSFRDEHEEAPYRTKLGSTRVEVPRRAFRVASQGPAKTFIWVYSRDSSNLPQDIADLIHDKPKAYSAPAMEPRAIFCNPSQRGRSSHQKKASEALSDSIFTSHSTSYSGARSTPCPASAGPKHKHHRAASMSYGVRDPEPASHHRHRRRSSLSDPNALIERAKRLLHLEAEPTEPKSLVSESSSIPFKSSPLRRA